MLHKLRAAMVRPWRDSIGQQHPVEVDETLVGGATQGEGRGRHHKTLVVGAAEVMARTDVKWTGRDPNLPQGQHRGGHGRGVLAGRLRFQIVPDRKQETLVPFVQANIASDAEVRTDGWIGYAPLASLGYRHMPVAVRGDHAKTDVLLPTRIVFDARQLVKPDRARCLCSTSPRKPDARPQTHRAEHGL